MNTTPFLKLLQAVAPPPAQIPLAYDAPVAFPAVDVTVTDQIPYIVERWKAQCPGPFRSGKPCAETPCTYRLHADAGLEGCAYIHQLRAQVGTLDPNETVALVSSMLAQLIPVIQANTQTQVEAANTIQRTVSPILLKVLLLLWSLSTATAVWTVIWQVVASL